MARRDNVKARKRLKKPKKIYTNTPVDEGLHNPGSRKFIRKLSPTRQHTRLHGTYTDPSGKIRVRRQYDTRISIHVQSARSKQFNKYGLQGDMSPQRIQAIAKKIDTFLISQRVSPETRDKIRSAWKRYASAAYGYYRSKTDAAKERNANIIKFIERNTNLLGLKASFVREDKVKEAYVLNPLTQGMMDENFNTYEKWYNAQKARRIAIREKAPEKRDEGILMPELNGLIDAINLGAEYNESNVADEYDDSDFQETSIEETQEEEVPINNDPDDFVVDWVDYWFYSIGEVEEIITKMGGWARANADYPQDVVRICNNAGYSTNEMYEILVHGATPSAPSPELVWENMGNSSNSYSNTDEPYTMYKVGFDKDGNPISYKRKG